MSMRVAQTILFFIMLTFAEALLIPFPLVFIALFLWAQFRSEEEAFFSVLLCGFLFDVLFLRTFGTTPLLFLILLWLTMLYKQKYSAHNIIFLGLAAFVSIGIIEYSYQSSMLWVHATLGMILTLFLAKVHFKMENSYEPWYRVS